MGKPIYQEEIGPNMAKQILQEEFVHGDDMQYFIISELGQMTVLQHNKATGEDIETRLEEAVDSVDLEVPKIEKYKSEYKEQKPIGIKIQLALLTAVGIALIACIIFLAMIGG